MAQVVFNWWGADVAKVGVKEFQRRLAVAAQLLKDTIRESLDTPYPPASEPGQPPAKRTGLLKQDIDIWEQDIDSLFIGVRDNALAYYAEFLEIGTSIMAARPFLRPALLRVLPEIRRIMGVPITAVVKRNVSKTNK